MPVRRACILSSRTYTCFARLAKRGSVVLLRYTGPCKAHIPFLASYENNMWAAREGVLLLKNLLCVLPVRERQTVVPKDTRVQLWLGL